ncbi:hypothetical protein SLEP1_g20149 [Rubroshorea leprosula]|uniref:Uncharacterized protein n=1 Tax=Rubroshorea leprosula TaxID=152421 RepID=A0AAV5JCE0_9ROSI|nr:hypothetical protein SLEP1_g20149 [Rubroshorea leprosula]
MPILLFRLIVLFPLENSNLIFVLIDYFTLVLRFQGIGKNLEWVPVAIPTLRPLTSSRNAPRYTPMKPPGTSSL